LIFCSRRNVEVSIIGLWDSHPGLDFQQSFRFR